MRRATAPLATPLVLVALLAGCTSTPAPDEPVASSWSVELSTAPTLLAMDGDDVWAASFGNGVGGSQVYRVDRRTGRRVAQRTLAGQPSGLALGPDGALWLTTERLPDQPGGTGLQVLDPQTLATRRAVPGVGAPLGIAVVDGRLWVGDEAGVRPVDGGVPVRTAEPALRLVAAGPGRLLAAGRSSLALVDTTASQVVSTRRVATSGSLVATAGAAGVWTVAPDAVDRAQLVRHDPATLAPALTAGSPGRAGAVALLAGDALWVSDPSGGRLLCLDPRTGEVRSETAVPVSGPLVADDRAVVVATAGGARSVEAAC